MNWATVWKICKEVYSYMDVYGSFVVQAHLLTEICNDAYKNRNNKMGYYMLLTGGMGYKLARGDGDHNYYAAIDGIFGYQAKHPEEPVKEGYLEGLRVVLKSVYDEYSISSTISMLIYQKEKQEEKPGVIDLDIEELVIELRNSINSSKKLRKSIKNYNAFIQESNDYMAKKGISSTI